MPEFPNARKLKLEVPERVLVLGCWVLQFFLGNTERHFLFVIITRTAWSVPWYGTCGADEEVLCREIHTETYKAWPGLLHWEVMYICGFNPNLGWKGPLEVLLQVTA